MIEALMGLSLILMGVYFVKSTDLPKELKERSADYRSESTTNISSKRKIVYTTDIKKTIAVNEPSSKNNHRLIELHNKAIDELTLKITSLEQQLKTNNEKNAEIQNMIDIHLESLRLLNNKKIVLG